MKLGRLTLLGLLGYAGYKLYQNRDQVKENLSSLKESGQAASLDLDRIKSSLTTIQEQTANIQEMSQDLTYKLRVFQEESKPRLAEIQQRMAKYQTPENK
ncbi:chemotaxis protein [Streptococcus loxodontisalivarius]|uniref:Gas vesicle protein n=1 Tax=Streptococcus loxodontisalivarius TaxID=1349415 RepID=A0ABS2PTX2_9STRE|nr:chemotaxis protein [Streptococcus loxodontisalivarius]MBM7643460.1 gas vesicle protein [Streptococcus loxodontisalivarius]